MPEIQVVCFDLGGVLVRLSANIEAAAARVGIRATEPAGWSEPAALKRRGDVIRRYHRGDISCEEYYREFARACDERFDARAVQALHAGWLLGEYAGVAALVARLNQTPGLRTACLSNTAHAHWDQMTRSASHEYPAVNLLQCRMASHLLKMVKPDPEIYEQAVAQLGVAPNQVLFFDDLPDNVAAARQVGLYAERVDPEQETAPQIEAAVRRRIEHF
jgi:putative hydrolase of the HAD superfamily